MHTWHAKTIDTRMSFLCQTRYLASLHVVCCTLLHAAEVFAMFSEPHSSSVVYGVGMIKPPLEYLSKL